MDVIVEEVNSDEEQTTVSSPATVDFDAVYDVRYEPVPERATSAHEAVSQAPNSSQAAEASIVVHGSGSRADVSLSDKVRQTTRQDDDSATAFGEQYVDTFGSLNYSPEPSAPPFDEEYDEYQAWLRSDNLKLRRRFPKNQQWQESLKHTSVASLPFQPKIGLEDLPKDVLSQQFVDTANAQYRQPDAAVDKAMDFFTGGQSQPPHYRDPEVYIPKHILETQGELSVAEWQQFTQRQPFDEIELLYKSVEEDFKISSTSKKLTGGTEIHANKFMVLSDHDGKDSGTRYYLWGPGLKQTMSGASRTAGANLNRVRGSAESYDLSTDYVHIPARFTVVRINRNEVGFLVSRNEGNRLLTLLPGRYFIHEKYHGYLGKSLVSQQPRAGVLASHPDCQEDFITGLAEQLSLVYCQPGAIAFVRDPKYTYVLHHREQPYLLDGRRGETFINYAAFNNQQVIRARDNSYTVVNRLQPGEYIVFKYNTNYVVWAYSDDPNACQVLHLPAAFFEFDGRINNLAENINHKAKIDVVYLRQNQTLVLYDDRQNVRFFEQDFQGLLVLRHPWSCIDIIAKSQKNYQLDDEQGRNLVVRLRPTSNEWSMVLSREGQLQFYPSLLDGTPYYFYPPASTFLRIIDKNTEGETKIPVPGIGDVSVVNLPSGSIGRCKLNNMYFFLNPSPMPYIFVPPNAYIDTVDKTQPHVTLGDLHRLYIRPEERAVISKDGELIELPSDLHTLSHNEQGNGIYIFRSFNLEMYGPNRKSEKAYTLGTIQYFNVDIGEVGYGYVKNKLITWGAGEHKVDNRRDEWFRGFFGTNVDPVAIDNLPVTFNHGVTAHIDIYVTYRIEDPNKAIMQFKTHENLHDYMAKTTTAEILDLCSNRPPIGFSAKDFDVSLRNNLTEEHEEQKSVNDIESSFEEHVKDLLEGYGIKLSKMRITRWNLDSEFVNKIREIAIRLQEAKAENEKIRIQSERTRLLNQQKIQDADINLELQRRENLQVQQKMQQEKELAVIQAQQAAEIEMSKQMAVARAQAEIAKAEALAKTAAARAEAEARAEIATYATQTAEAQLQAHQFTAQSKRVLGEAEAKVVEIMRAAQYPEQTAEQRHELQLADRLRESLTAMVTGLAQSGAVMPGVLELNTKLIEALAKATSTTLLGGGQQPLSIQSQNPAQLLQMLTGNRGGETSTKPDETTSSPAAQP